MMNIGRRKVVQFLEAGDFYAATAADRNVNLELGSC